MADFSLLLKKAPSGWKEFRLGDICMRVQNNYHPDPNGTRLYLGLEHLAQGLPMLVGRGSETDVKSSKNTFRPNDVLFGKLRPYLRKCVLLQEEGVCSTDILVFRANNNVLPQYLCYLCNTDQFVGHARATTSGVQHPRTSWNSLSGFRLTLPPIAEQRRITYVLSILQDAIEQQVRLIKLTHELKSALMHKLFTEGLQGKKQKMTEIGPVPESWDVVKISQAYTFTEKKRQAILSRPIPFIPMELISIGENEMVHYETREKVTSGTYVENGDLLIAKITPSFENGKQGILKIPFEKAFATTEVIPIKAIQGKSNLLYLHYYLFMPNVRSTMAGKMEGTTGRQRLSKTIVGEQLIPFPKILEQEEISQMLSKFDDKILVTKRKKTILEELFRTLLHQLMTGQTRVNDIDLPGFS